MVQHLGRIHIRRRNGDGEDGVETGEVVRRGGGGGGRGRESSGGSFDKWGAPDVKPGVRKRTARGIGSRRKFPRDDHWKDPRSEEDEEDDEDDDLADFIVDDAPTGGPPHADDVLTDEPTPYAGGVATARDWLTGTGGAGGGVGSRYWSEPPATLPGRRSGSWGEHREPGGWGVNDGAGGSVRVRKKPAAPPIEVIDEQPSGDDVDRTDDVDRSLQGASEGKGKSRSYPWRRKGRRKGKGRKGTHEGRAGERGSERGTPNRDVTVYPADSEATGGAGRAADPAHQTSQEGVHPGHAGVQLTFTPYF